MELIVYNISGEKTSKKVRLNDSIFNIEPNDHAIYLDAKQIMANRRQGTHSTKERSDIVGSTRKIKRQKGTGTARFGDIKNPIFRGGGRTFGPLPRDYSFKLNKKLKRLARKSALSYKAKEEKIMVLEDFSFEAPRTKSYIEMLTNLELQDQKTLLLMSDVSENVVLSSRNLQNTKVMRVSDINTYDILNAGKILFVESSLKIVDEIFG